MGQYRHVMIFLVEGRIECCMEQQSGLGEHWQLGGFAGKLVSN